MLPGSWNDPIAQDFSMCYSWPFYAAEQYSGDFTAKTHHPVLYVNPTWDPVTPLASARNSSSTLEGSVVLEHRGHGHSVFAQPSLCTATYMRDYMIDGTLPDEDTVCEPDISTFTNMTRQERALEQNKIFKDLITEAKAVDLEAMLAENENGTDSEGSGSSGSGSGSGSAAPSEDDNSSASTLSVSSLGLAGLIGVLMLAV
jgi:hypothetical protein